LTSVEVCNEWMGNHPSWCLIVAGGEEKFSKDQDGS
jgi:hypothetical protein